VTFAAQSSGPYTVFTPNFVSQTTENFRIILEWQNVILEPYIAINVGLELCFSLLGTPVK
jgi:hypothetical protein